MPAVSRRGFRTIQTKTPSPFDLELNQRGDYQPLTNYKAPNMNHTLYELSDELAELLDHIQECGGEIMSPEIEQALDQLLEEGGEVPLKVDRYAGLIQEMKARAEIRSRESKRLAMRATIDQNTASSLESRLEQFFLRHGFKKIETPRFQVRVQRNGGIAPLEILVPVNELPEDVLRLKPEPNKELIRQRIEAGEKVDYAVLHERGYSVRIA